MNESNPSMRRSLSEMEYLVSKLNFLHNVSQKISEKKSLGKLLDEIMISSTEVMNAETSSFLLFDEQDGKLHFHVLEGKSEDIIKQFPVEIGKGIAGWVAEQKKPLLIEDCYADPRFNPEYDKKSNFITKSMICVPLLRKDKLLGVLSVINKKDEEVFRNSDLEILQTLAAQCAIAIENTKLIQIQIENETIERELKTARSIQQKILPDKLPKYDDLQIAAIVDPAMQVGGDYYDVIKLNENQSLFIITDVSGKSISAALIVSTIYSSLYTYKALHEKDFVLKDFVKSLNKVLVHSTTSDKFATAWIALYNHNKNTLESINAGHNPPYLLRKHDDQLLTLNEGGTFLGIMDLPFDAEIIELHPGDLLIAFTDGVTEAWNNNEEEYGEKRLENLILQNRNKPSQEILTTIINDVKKHVGRANQSDDITCIVLKKK